MEACTKLSRTITGCEEALDGHVVAGQRLDVALASPSWGELDVALPGPGLLIIGTALPYYPLTHQGSVAPDFLPGRSSHRRPLPPRHLAVPLRPATAPQGELVVAQPMADTPRADHRSRLTLSPSPGHRGKLVPARRVAGQPLEGGLLLDALLVAGDQVRFCGGGRLERYVGSPVPASPAPVLEPHHQDDADCHQGETGHHADEHSKGRGDRDALKVELNSR